MTWSMRSLNNIMSRRLFLPLVTSALWLLLSPLTASASPLQTEVVNVAESYTYVRESRPNAGPEIKRWLGYLGLKEGNPYCAAFVLGCYNEASQNLTITQPLPKTARVSTLWSSAKKNPYKYKTFIGARVKQGIDSLEKADVIIWSHNKLPGNSNWNGHTGVVVTQTSKNSFISVEGNTSSGVRGSQRDGDGVFTRTRTLGIGTKFPVEGFIRVK